MSQELLSGNEAIARGAWEAGVRVAAGYPGTPSTEILETLARWKDKVYCEWSPNEKVALEVAAGAAFTGVRALVTMKHVGLNVAADPLMTLSYIGVVGGLVLVVCDDPGQHSSQTEQDTRHYARLAKVPILEPGDAREALLFTRRAFELSERFACPVILRSTTAVSHSRALVATGDRAEAGAADFRPEPSRFVPLPAWGRVLRAKVEERMAAQAAAAACDDGLNAIVKGDGQLGIIASGITAVHCRDVFPDADLLKLGWSWPFPDELILRFARGVARLAVIEEGDPVLEEHVKSLGLACEGKNLVPRTGELTPTRLAAVRAALKGQGYAPPDATDAEDLPSRPPILCAGCPHRGVFYALGKMPDILVTGDIGCYSLGVLPPLSKTDALLCMGGGFTLAHGMAKEGEKRRLVGVVGDSTFFHSGITGLLDVVYNQSNVTLVVVDNRTTAMTGHQAHPGTGRTLMDTPAPAASIEKIAAACGLARVTVVNPYDLDATLAVFREALSADGPSLVVSRAPCVLCDRSAMGAPREIRADACRNCRACVKLGCPAVEAPDKDVKPVIDTRRCPGCGLCARVCRFDAIHEAAE